MPKIILYGLWISLIGCLPLGVLNITAMQIALQENMLQALYFILGIIVVEIIYVRITLLGLDKIINNKYFINVLKIVSIFILLLMLYSSIKIIITSSGIEKNTFLEVPMHRFLLGIFLSAINPFQFPYWVGWSSILIEKQILQRTSKDYWLYVLGIAIGTGIGNGIFVVIGELLHVHYDTFNRVIHIGLSIFYIISIFLVLQKRKSPKHTTAIT